jgi:hypothetical protein
MEELTSVLLKLLYKMDREGTHQTHFMNLVLPQHKNSIGTEQKIKLYTNFLDDQRDRIFSKNTCKPNSIPNYKDHTP